jgi:hypothetical protein
MIRCLRLRRCAQGTVRALVDLELLPAGGEAEKAGMILLRYCAWHEENGEEWVTLAAPVRVICEDPKEMRDEFQRRAPAAIRAAAQEEQCELEALQRRAIEALHVATPVW